MKHGIVIEKFPGRIGVDSVVEKDRRKDRGFVGEPRRGREGTIIGTIVLQDRW